MILDFFRTITTGARVSLKLTLVLVVTDPKETDLFEQSRKPTNWTHMAKTNFRIDFGRDALLELS